MPAPYPRSDQAPGQDRVFDDVDGRWTIGSPAVPDIGKRTLAAGIALAVLIGMLFLLSA